LNVLGAQGEFKEGIWDSGKEGGCPDFGGRLKVRKEFECAA